MHLKTYSTCLEVVGVETSSPQSSLYVSQQGALLKTCSGNRGNISSRRLPFSVISTNTRNANHVSRSMASLWLKASSSITLPLLPPPPVLESDTLRFCHTATEDVDTPLDIWTVIKPGNVREKIAIFASEGGRPDGTRGSGHTSTSGPDSQGQVSPACTTHMSGLTRAVKAKGSWEENCCAKRRRCSASNQNQNLQQDQRTQGLDTQQPNCILLPQHSDSIQSSGGRWRGDEVVTAVEEEEQKVSVVDMVAFLEQRVNEQQLDCKPVLTLQRSSTTITLSKPPPPEFREGLEDRGEEPEGIKVSDMVAKLESDCLRRRTEGDLSRNNSLRRTVGRVLLTTGDQSSAPSHPTSSVGTSSSSSLRGDQCPSSEPISCSKTIRKHTPASVRAMPPRPMGRAPPPLAAQHVRVGEALETYGTLRLQIMAPPPQPKGAEPVPGLLFLSLPGSPATDAIPPHRDSGPHPCRHNATFDLKSAPSQPWPCALSSSPESCSQSDSRRWRKADGGQEKDVVCVSTCSAAAPLSRRTSVSQDFLEMRQRLQQLLEPQPYLAVLPHHLLVKIFLLLPTQSLAVLKCTCHYFKFIIENYGVRPADSLWMSDPRYRDDPCKQCKKRYNRGDVSLCRWHHKPYCQALPYGPGYWMCCHGAHRDTPGCNVGLHDNRWVPVFHRINVPIYKRSHDD